MSEPIFTISGLRGVVGRDLTPELAASVAAGFGTLVDGGTVAVGRDCRSSGSMLFHAVASGLAGAGCRVLNLGICPTPTVPLLVRQEKLDGGLVITASHNPPEWNGLKFISSSAAFLTEWELSDLKHIIRRREFLRAPWDGLGQVVAREDAIDIHIRRILGSRYFQKRPRRKLRIGIDACNGAASVAAPRLVQRLGSTPSSLFCARNDGGSFPRLPEPIADHLTELGRFVRRQRLDLGVAFDPDGDRFSAVDEAGRPLGEEASVMLATDFVLRRTPGPVVVNLSTTRGVEDIAMGYDAEVSRSRVGEAAVVAMMKETGAVVGGEGNGGVIIPAINTTRDGLTALAMLVQAISDSGKPLSAIARDLPHYVMLKDRVTGVKRAWPDIRKSLRARFPAMAADSTDGIKFSDKDSWLHVRVSNTEPIIRLIAEARTGTAARRLLRQAKAELAGPVRK